MASAANAVHLVCIPLLLSCHRHPRIHGMLHVGGNRRVCLDQPLLLVERFPLQLSLSACGARSVIGLRAHAIHVAHVQAPIDVRVERCFVDELGLGLGIARGANHELSRLN